MSKTRVYVGRLSSRTRERDLDDVFSKYGRVQSCDLKYGYAFVEFEDPRDAEDAVRALDGHNLDGSRIVVEFSRGGRRSGPRGGYNRGPPQRSDYRVAIEGLPRDISWQDLKDHFRKIGDVLFADVYPQDRSGRVKGVVEFKTRDDMRHAIRELDETELRGSVITVREDDSRARSRSPRRRPRSRSPRRRYSRSPRRKKYRSESRSKSPKRKSKSPTKRSKSGSPRKSPSPSRSPPKPETRSDSRSPKPNSPSRSTSRSPKRSRSRSKSKSPAPQSPKQGSPKTNHHEPDDKSPSPKRSPSPPFVEAAESPRAD